MNFIVTGGAGFIGSHIAKLLVTNGHKVIIIDNLSLGRIENLSDISKHIDFYNIDILEYEKLKSIAKHADGIFHLAGLTDVRESFTKQEQYHLINVKGTENVLKIAREIELKMIFASSASVYGDTKQIPITENTYRNPINPYGQNKLDCELLCERYAEKGVQVIGLRYFNVFGYGQNKAYAGVISKFYENIKNKKPPVIHGDGRQVRDFVFVEDVASANLAAMLSNKHTGFFNIGSGKAISIINLAHMMIRLSGLELQPIHDAESVGDVLTSQADITLARQLGWQPQTTLEHWLQQVFSSKIVL
jgi:UDP-glucose 4-epimerase